MTKQTKAQRLAEFLIARQSCLGSDRFSMRDDDARREWDNYKEAAAELRRLDALNAALVEALEDFSSYVRDEQCATDGFVTYSNTQIHRLVFKARAALAKSKGADMTTDREVMQMALDAMDSDSPDIQLRAATTLRARLAQREEKPEPVAFGIIACNTGKICEVALSAEEVAEIHPRYIAPLYAEPQKRSWQGLTDEELCDVCEALGVTVAGPASEAINALFRAIEAKLKEKNA